MVYHHAYLHHKKYKNKVLLSTELIVQMDFQQFSM